MTAPFRFPRFFVTSPTPPATNPLGSSGLTLVDYVVATAAGQTLSARECLRVLVRNHLEVLLGAESDFIPVMLYEWRSLAPAQRKAITELKDDYEAAWMPVLQALHDTGQLQAPVGLARLMIFGALNWSVQWYEPARKNKVAKRATLDELTDTALQLFLKDTP